MTACVELRGGMFVRTDAIELALALETDGHALSVQDGALIVSHGATLTEDQKAAIRTLRRHLIAIAGYEAP